LITRKNIQIPDFRMKVATYLTKCHDNEIEVSIPPRESLLRKPRYKLKATPERLKLWDNSAKYVIKKIPKG
jgi:hypothetical protein